MSVKCSQSILKGILSNFHTPFPNAIHIPHMSTNSEILLYHTWQTIVFIQPGVQEMSIIICASKVSVDQY